jgi:uncharacterized coiled-coil DUF342 family protein
MTQTISNYQETVNTLHFGQKAKHVRTTINANELSSLTSTPEMEKAQKDIQTLKKKLKDYEKMISKLKTAPVADQNSSQNNSNEGNSSKSSSMDIDKSSNFSVITKDKLLID